jgi:hypothetical protein
VGEASGLGASLRTLPGQLDQVLHDFETGNLMLRAVTPQLDTLPGVVHQTGSRLVLALFAAAMTLATAVVLPETTGQPWHGLLAATCAALAAGAWTILFVWHFVRGKPLKVTPLMRFFRR